MLLHHARWPAATVWGLLAAHIAAAAQLRAQSGQHGHRIVPLSSTDSLAVPPPATKTGCATFDIRIAGGRVSVAAGPATDCGPIQPVIAGLPTLDSSRRILHVPIALHNGGEDRMHTPASLVAKGGSVVLVTDSSTSADAPGPVPHYVAGDSPRDSVGAALLLDRWSYDTLKHPLTDPRVLAGDGSVVLPPGATSVALSIDLEVPPRVTAFSITLVGFGTYVLTVPARPPDRVPPSELLESRSTDNVITGDPHFPGRVVRNRLWLLFRRDATPEQREAAIEDISGMIVGGSTQGTGNGYPPPSGSHTIRYYYVAFPAYPDSGAAPLERAIGKLASLPQVQDVRADILGQNWGSAVP